MSRAAQGAPIPGARFVDPKVLARIGNLDLLARTVVDGFINGLHRSPYFGASIDFAEHRGYVPGDDIRRVDWRLYARTDRYYVKEYEADSNSNFAVLLDVSRSMSFGSHAVTKLDYAKYIAACLTYLAHRQRDRVGIATFDSSIVEHVPCSAKHFNIVLYALDRAQPGRPGALGQPLDKFAEHFGRRGILALISDFYEEPDTIKEAVRRLKARGNDVIVIHVLDPAELSFDFTQPSVFQDLETDDQMPIVPVALAEQYRALIREHTAAIASSLSADGIDYALFDTSQPLDYALFSYLASRDRATRVR